MMFKLVSSCILVATLAAQTVSAFGLDLNDSSVYDDEGRLLVIPVGNSPTAGLSFNISTIAPFAAMLASALVTVLGLGALGFLLYALLAGGFGYGYGSGSSYGNSGGGYSSYSSYRRSFDPYGIDWEKFSILDWIAIGEEAWRKFDPSDLECQKRLICEVHQNTSRFGTPAARLVDIFSYLQYAEVLSLPDEIKALIEEYNDAADRGRSLQKDCGEVYTTCDFSVKKIMDKYSHNEI
ncbi:uncharacterized protein [Panulirus ornatus]|uniref:uncharacterized protein isoform X2 n=1 Tax=Panulirus ornatus TaxID=150431 RepID=UPI003A8B747F